MEDSVDFEWVESTKLFEAYTMLPGVASICQNQAPTSWACLQRETKNEVGSKQLRLNKCSDTDGQPLGYVPL